MGRLRMMVVAAVIAASALKARAACDGKPGEAGAVKISVSAVQRTALVRLPSGYDAHVPRPVVFVFHGFTMNAHLIESLVNVGEAWPEAIVVYPQGLDREVEAWGSGSHPGWQLYAGELENRDLAFFDTLLAWLRVNQCIDEKRVFAMGLSNGGYFAHLLGCERPKAIAAIAPAAGGSKCEPRMPLPVIISHGTTDTLVGYDQAVAAAQAWARRNPSLDEGFGFPPLEAMACGTPTVASSAGALAENLSGAAVLVDPSAAAIQLAVARVLHDPARLESLRAAGFARARQFTWENTARATRACYEELARHA